MTSALLLSAWVAIGLVTAARAALPTESRWAWAPVAMILGPLWLTVAREQRTAQQIQADDDRDGDDEDIDLEELPPEVRWIHEDHRMIP